MPNKLVFKNRNKKNKLLIFEDKIMYSNLNAN